MRVFRPEETYSTSEIANWVFIRSAILFVLILNGAIFLEAMIGTGVPIWVFGLWFWLQLLFRGIGAYERTNEERMKANADT